jgi:hypothetical protein
MPIFQSCRSVGRGMHEPEQQLPPCFAGGQQHGERHAKRSVARMYDLFAPDCWLVCLGFPSVALCLASRRGSFRAAGRVGGGSYSSATHWPCATECARDEAPRFPCLQKSSTMQCMISFMYLCAMIVLVLMICYYSFFHADYSLFPPFPSLTSYWTHVA